MPALLAFLESAGDIAYSPFIVPIAGCAMIACIVVASIASKDKQAALRSRERLECIARGITPPPTEEEIAATQQRPAASLARRRANLRLTGIILVFSAFGLMLFFVALSVIVRTREVLAGAAVALVPLAMGIGFLYDTRIQTQEIEEAKTGS